MSTVPIMGRWINSRGNCDYSMCARKVVDRFYRVQDGRTQGDFCSSNHYTLANDELERGVEAKVEEMRREENENL